MKPRNMNLLIYILSRSGKNLRKMENHSLCGGPPELTIHLPRECDFPSASEINMLKPGYCVIDIQLLTVKDCEFSSCYHYLQHPSRYYYKDIGSVYIGKMGNGDENKKLVVGLKKCSMGSGDGGSTVMVQNVVKFLRPKVVFCVGFCRGMNATRLGDVVVATKLIMYAQVKNTKDGIERRGPIVPLNKKLNDISHHVAVGWKPPLKDKKQQGNVITGSLLSGPMLVNDGEERDRLLKAYPDATAIEMEGEGLLHFVSNTLFLVHFAFY